MKTTQKVLIGFLIFIFIAYFISKHRYDEKYGKTQNTESGTNIINDNNTYSYSWREPSNDEMVKISKIMVNKYITGCGEYYVKEVTINEYMVACTSNGKIWTYYVVYTLQNKIFMANNEMLKKLTPPY